MNSKTYTLAGGPAPADVRITDPEGRDVTGHFIGIQITGNRGALLEVRLTALAAIAPEGLKAELFPEVQIGSFVRDTVSRFVGTVTARAVYMGGTVRFLVAAEFGERTGGRTAEEWFDAGRLELAERAS